MIENHKKIITAYYEALNQGFKTGKLNLQKMHLDEDVILLAAHEQCKGYESIIKKFEHYIQVVDHYEIRNYYFDANSCVTILDCITKPPVSKLLICEWFIFKNGKIKEIYPIFDTSTWQKILQER